MPSMHRTMGIWLLLAILLAPLGTRAQIINTLRGFDDDAPGWAGQVEGAVALADGNSDYVEFGFAARAQHRSARQRWRFIGHLLDRSSEGVTIAENRMAHIRHNYHFVPRVSSVTFLQGQHDRFRRLETRILAGIGARADLVQSDGFDAALSAAYMWETEQLTDDDMGFTTDHRASCFLSLLGKPSPTLKVDVSAFYQPLLRDFRDARASVSASVRADIVGGLYLLMNYALVHDSNPPVGVEETDQSLRSGVGFEF